MMELNKEKIKDLLNELPFSQQSYWVLMGAALVMYGIKDTTHDIDLGCTDELFAHLRESGYSVVVNRMGKAKIRFSDYITIYQNWLCDSNVMIEGVPVCDLNTIIKDKQALGRGKDLADLQLIALFQGDEQMG